jgi:hypothetical protein
MRSKLRGRFTTVIFQSRVSRAGKIKIQLQLARDLVIKSSALFELLNFALPSGMVKFENEGHHLSHYEEHLLSQRLIDSSIQVQK